MLYYVIADIANLTLSQHLFEKKKKTKFIYSFYQCLLEYEQNDRKVKESKSKNEARKKRILRTKITTGPWQKALVYR